MLIDVRDLPPATPRKMKGAINPLIREILTLMKPVFSDQEIEIQIDLDPNLPEFEFDPDQLKQVLLNLIKNAAEAMTARRPPVDIKTHTREQNVFIEISDTGQGISPEHLGNLFRPFFTTKKKGTGLGLATYKLVQDHNGDIRVNSEVNQGTRVVVQLPLQGWVS